MLISGKAVRLESSRLIYNRAGLLDFFSDCFSSRFVMRFPQPKKVVIVKTKNAADIF